MEWKNHFSAPALQAGLEYFRDGKVENLRKTERGYEAMVSGDQFYQVRIGIGGGRVRSLYCDCQEGKVNTRCKHMAAVLFAVEEYEESLRLTSPEGETEPYVYFRTEEIRQSLNVSAETFAEAKKLADAGKVTLTEVYTGYVSYQKEMVGSAGGVFKRGKSEYELSLIFSETKVETRSCECPSCRPGPRAWYQGPKETCVHIAALFLLLERYLKEHPIGGATDRIGSELIQSFQKKRASNTMRVIEDKEARLVIRPRMIKRGREFSADFHIGVSGGKSFLIRGLSDFVNSVHSGEDVQYGSSTVLNHDIGNFTQESLRYIHLLENLTEEEKEFARRVNSGFYRTFSGEIGQQIELTGKQMDCFFEALGGDPLNYEERDGKNKTKSVLACREGNPRIALEIGRIKGGSGFRGIEASAEIPDLIYGMNNVYYIEDGILDKMDKTFSDALLPFFRQAAGNIIFFQVGRDQLQSFYYTVLPMLRQFLEIEIRDEELIERYLQPEVQFLFYLDAEDQEVTCRAHAVYGNSEVSLMDNTRDGWDPEPFRDLFRENEALFCVRRYFTYIREESDEFCSGDGEEEVYSIISEGVQELMKFGEVRSTERFHRINVAKHTKLSVGVSLSGGLLNLEIDSEDISREELLDVLKSYRKKKKYHRLKNGDFLSLEDDSCQMVGELLDTLQIRPKDFVSGKMQVPAYRALYVDRMLEEHDSVYGTRNSRFRKLIKDFRSVADADYEVLSSLQRVLRGYQKIDYSWLRTLEAGHFGGILADDMGLGKTLQVISVLLAHKEEGGVATSLIICPASLVYNWAEEFARFAPSLRVETVTGSGEERQKKIQASQNCDVLVTSYDLLKRDIDLYEDLSFDCEILDEAQYIKNHTTAATKTVKLIRSTSRFALTGTPIENRLSELWSIFDYLMPGFLYSYEEFRQKFETRIVRQGDEEAAKRLRTLVSPFILRRLKTDVLKDLPDKIEESRYVRFGEEQQTLYNAQVVHMQQKIALQVPEDFQKNRFEILAELTRLRQICCDPSLCFEDYHGGSAKLEACMELVESALGSGHRILLFSQFTSMLALLQSELEKQQISYYVITGSTPKEKRMSMVKQFNQNDVQVFLISLKAGGTGLNLTGADVVIHYDPWWNVAAQNQATDRAHRIGQEKPVTVYKLIVKGSVEEKIQKLQENKRDLADQIITGELKNLSSMTQEELMDLLS